MNCRFQQSQRSLELHTRVYDTEKKKKRRVIKIISDDYFYDTTMGMYI